MIETSRLFGLALLALPFTTLAAQVPETAVPAADLTEARRGFETRLTELRSEGRALHPPPPELFSLVRYESPAGSMQAFLSHIEPGEDPLPAIVWLTGGWPVARGGGYVWQPGPFDNDQSASAYREEGIVMLFPTVRGTAENAGHQELFYGEVDDVLASAAFLRKHPRVDPNRMYLGGHSTGGTLALLVAESTDLFRAVFSFGPVPDLADYGERSWPFDASDPRELRLRSSIHFLEAIRSPTYVIEGESGNVEDLLKLHEVNTNPRVRTLLLPDADHFMPLAPINRYLARLVATHAEGAFDVDLADLAEAYSDGRSAEREGRDLRNVAAMRSSGLRWGELCRVRFTLMGYREDRLRTAGEVLAQQGYRAGPVSEGFDEDRDPCLRRWYERSVPLEVAELLKCSETVDEVARERFLDYEGWTFDRP